MTTIANLVKLDTSTVAEIMRTYEVQATTKELNDEVEYMFRKIEEALLAYKKINPRAKRRVGRRLQIIQRYLQRACRRTRDYELYEKMKGTKADPFAETELVHTNYSFNLTGYSALEGYSYGWS